MRSVAEQFAGVDVVINNAGVGLTGSVLELDYADLESVRGFTESLRQELRLNRLPVRVCCVHPGGIRTAIARNARAAAGEDQAALADFFDRKLAKTSADRAAELIVTGMLAGKPKILVGADARLLDLLVRLLGARYQGLVTAVSRRRVPQRLGAGPISGRIEPP